MIALIPFEALTEYDFEILKRCSGGKAIDIDALVRSLSNQRAVKLRIKLLSKPEYVYHEDLVGRQHAQALDDSSYLKVIGETVTITELGQKALEDYSQREAYKVWNWIVEFLKLFFAAVLASVLTQVLT